MPIAHILVICYLPLASKSIKNLCELGVFVVLSSSFILPPFYVAGIKTAL
jgi:hypothetical protein